MTINKHKSFCYRITHRDNLTHMLRHGLISGHHPSADGKFVSIGNPEIIDVRSATAVDIVGYGYIGDYVPFYFTPRSIMLYNIVTGYYAPKVPRRNKEEILVIRCLIDRLAQLSQWFFTDGQANDKQSNHYNNLLYLNQIDWNCIQQSNFSKSDGDYDRQRRYQAEFLVHHSVPVGYIESICVYSEEVKEWAAQQVKGAGYIIPLHVHKPYFFD